MDCIVSVHYKDSGFELEQCDVHRRKRDADDREKELEYKVELLVEEPKMSTTTTPDGNSAEMRFVTVGLFLWTFAV